MRSDVGDIVLKTRETLKAGCKYTNITWQSCLNQE